MEIRHVVCLFFVLFEGPQMQRLSASFTLYPFGTATPIFCKNTPIGYIFKILIDNHPERV